MQRSLRMLSPVRFVEVSEFPESPEKGDSVFKDGVLYIYSTLMGETRWFGMNQPRATYVHDQTVASKDTLISHGLGTNDVIVGLWDAEGNAMDALVELVETPENPIATRYQIRVAFTVAEVFKAVIVASDAIATPGLITEYINAQVITVGGDPVVTQTELQASLDALSATFAEYA